MNRVRWWAAGLAAAVALAAAPSLAAAKSPPAREGHPAQELQAAKRLACAYVQGINAGFTPQGRVNLKPPSTPTRPDSPSAWSIRTGNGPSSRKTPWKRRVSTCSRQKG